ncbi:MAG: GAF domain-containing sensor histidine kinase [Oscillatoriophycideae cyanobacterium NC_groundwater_1537_Pr4_S-0.65um_50_18]|nr:GAF domain-containing sensor histidine kinase [Oscillatoriophycideae cyanobacterium NC_groundwater_1537_Pr4_S-0.65um_50_18]
MIIHKLRNSNKGYRQKTALLRRIVDRIRTSLELNVILQAVLDEVATLLHLDRCLFFWYFQDSQHIQVVCEHSKDGHLCYGTEYSLAELGTIAPWVQAGDAHVSLDRVTLEMLGVSVSLLIPVNGEEGASGFIACLGDRQPRWRTSEVDFMQAVAQCLEIAIRQTQLYEQTCQQAQQEQLINQITTLTRQSFDLNTILTTAIAQLLEALEIDRCLVHLIEDSNEASIARLPGAEVLPPVSRRRHLYEICRPPLASSIDIFNTHGPITQWVIQHREAVAIADITQDPRIGASNPEYEMAQIKSSLVVPVQADEQIHAILYLNQCFQTRRWSKGDRKLAQAVADQVAISIQQAHLYDQMQQQASASATQARHLAEALYNLRQTQTQLIHSEKISSLGQLVAGLAHEMNNPISFIYGNIPYIERYIEDLVFLMQCYQTRNPQIAEECHDIVGAIDLDFVMQDLPRTLHSLKVGATRIREIVQSLRSFAHVDQTQRCPVNLHQALEQALTSLSSQILPDIQLVRQYGEISTILGYPELLHQVLLNVLMNAIEALSSPGSPATEPTPKHITITTCPSSDLETAEPWVRLTIADNGCGIPAHVQSKIFDPFFTTKDVGQGTGLGLAISYHAIVNQHQGRLSVQSASHQGTECIIELPVKPSKNPSRRHSLFSQGSENTVEQPFNSISQPMPQQPSAGFSKGQDEG